MEQRSTHMLVVGYVLWLFGFFGAHRFYFGNRLTGTIWFFTFGLCFVGWLIDLLLMPALDAAADRRYSEGPYDYTVARILLTFRGVFGVHRYSLGKRLTGILYMFTGGLFLLGWLYDLLTLNEQVDDLNRHGLAY